MGTNHKSLIDEKKIPSNSLPHLPNTSFFMQKKIIIGHIKLKNQAGRNPSSKKAFKLYITRESPKEVRKNLPKIHASLIGFFNGKDSNIAIESTFDII